MNKLTRTKLTDAAVRKLPPAEAGQYIVRDTELRNFYLVVGKQAKTFTVQVDVPNPLGKAKTRKRTVGRFPEVGCVEARRLAQAAIVGLRDEPSKRAAGPKTLAGAWERLREALAREVEAGNRSQRTIDGYAYGFRLLAPWHDVPLVNLFGEGEEVAEMHVALTRTHGPGAANGAMKTLRRIYRHARKRDRTLPAGHPAEAVDLNPTRRRKTAMSADELAGWYAKLNALPNPVRREFHLFCLLSGSRPGALTVARWEHLDVRRRVLHIPRPKGGERRAFDIPLSRQMLACLARARRAGKMVNARNAAEWIFPGDLSRSRRSGGPVSAGHIVEYREDRKALPKWGGDLRQTYKTLAGEAGLSKTDVMVLMNHADSDVNDGYMTRSKVAEDYLRAQQEAMSRYLMAACRRG